jgi:hypothetical protein
MNAQQIGGLLWNILVVVAGFGLAITGGRYLHFIDRGFPDKMRENPDAAGRQVKTLRILGAAFGFCELVHILLNL